MFELKPQAILAKRIINDYGREIIILCFIMQSKDFEYLRQITETSPSLPSIIHYKLEGEIVFAIIELITTMERILIPFSIDANIFRGILEQGFLLYVIIREEEKKNLSYYHDLFEKIVKGELIDISKYPSIIIGISGFIGRKVNEEEKTGKWNEEYFYIA